MDMVVYREDLREAARGVPESLLVLTDLRSDHLRQAESANKVVYFNHGNIKILKDRHGDLT